ncbi:MAG TPA: PAS domain S-box protein [Candidatus Limnocylindrales bacterium]|nr:PAS domain S-box protein [Candidatus Limnocylindrales bacterium]
MPTSRAEEWDGPALDRIAELEERVRELERQLAESKDRELRLPLEQALDNIRSLPVILFRVDRNGILVESVGRGLERLGLQERQAVGQSIFDTFPEVADYIRRAQRGEEVLFEASGTFEGRPWSSINHYTLHEDSGDVIATALDITPLREMRRELEASERLFRALADTVPVGIARFDQKGRCTYLNKRVRDTLGLGDEDPLGFEWSAHIHPEDRQRIAQQWAERESGQETGRLLYRTASSLGERRWLQAQTVIERDGDGRAVGYVATVTDVTRQKRLEEDLGRRVAERTAALEEANREMEAFSYSVSHDLRAPLRSIDGFCRVLLEDYGPTLDETARGYLQRASSASKRMGALIDDLLRMSRVGRSEPRKEHVDLSAIARTVADEHAASEPSRKVDFAIQDGLTAQGDPALLYDVLVNLIGNAWKFTAKKDVARIEFCADAGEDGQIVYRVRDDGAGFDMSFADKLFRPFERLHDGNDFAGNGIGLATVERIIRRHGGRVWAEGRPGKGASFYFTLGR